MESTLRLVLSESQKLNLAKHCVLPIVQSRWGMKTMGYSLLRNTNELQDFISDLHSYPVVLNIPWFHNHYKWGIILKRIKQGFLMIPILVLKTENKVIYNQSNLNCKTFFEEYILCTTIKDTQLNSSFMTCLLCSLNNQTPHYTPLFIVPYLHAW